MDSVPSGRKDPKIQDTPAQAADENQAAEISIASDQQASAALSLAQDVFVGCRTKSKLCGASYVVPEPWPRIGP